MQAEMNIGTAGGGQISCTRFTADSEGLALREGLIRKLSFMGCDDLSHNWTRIEHEHCHKQAKLNCNFIHVQMVKPDCPDLFLSIRIHVCP